MCLPAAAAGAGAAAATQTAISAAGLAISAVSTIASVAQAQQSAAMQTAQAQQSMDLQYRQAQQAAYNERQQQQALYKGKILERQASNLAFNKQRGFNADAANRVYAQEQAKVREARQAAAFKAQENIAKTIGAQGSVLAAGGTGQSVGLLLNDAARAQGFDTAQQNATLDNMARQSAITMDMASDQQLSRDNQAFSQLVRPIQAPLLSPDPIGVGKNLNLGIPTIDLG